MSVTNILISLLNPSDPIPIKKGNDLENSKILKAKELVPRRSEWTWSKV
jgi:hypothetical protein